MTRAPRDHLGAFNFLQKILGQGVFSKVANKKWKLANKKRKLLIKSGNLLIKKESC
jgi:Fe-S cluster biosynthesis and repair protein YggX